MIVRIVDGRKKFCLLQTQLKSAELAREQLDDISHLRRWDKQRVDAVYDSICAKDVDGNDSAVEIDSQAFETNIRAQTLGLTTDAFASEQTGDGMGDKYAPSWVEVGGDMVGKDFLQVLL